MIHINFKLILSLTELFQEPSCRVPSGWSGEGQGLGLEARVLSRDVRGRSFEENSVALTAPSPHYIHVNNIINWSTLMSEIMAYMRSRGRMMKSLSGYASHCP